MEKGYWYSAYILPIDNNDSLCAARGAAGQNPSKIRWRHGYQDLIGISSLPGLRTVTVMTIRSSILLAPPGTTCARTDSIGFSTASSIAR